jgi:hypothetical protein
MKSYNVIFINCTGDTFEGELTKKLVRQNLTDGDIRLAGATELRPVAGDRRVQVVLQAAQRRLGIFGARTQRNEKRQRDAGQRRVYAGLQHRHPQHQPDEEIGREPLDTRAVER